MQQQSIEERKRKFLIALPVLVLPFISLLFYSLDGGKGTEDVNQARISALSSTLPDPLFDNSKPMDKMSLYQQADKDSIDKERAAAYDPFAQWMPADSTDLSKSGNGPPADKSPYSYSVSAPATKPFQSSESNRKKSPEEEVENKIAELEKLLLQADTLSTVKTVQAAIPADPDPQLQRLEAMMQELSVNQPEQTNPELRQAESMLEKILDIQHPDRVKERLREKSEQNKSTVYAVTVQSNDDICDILLPSSAITLMDTLPGIHKWMASNSGFAPASSGFYENDNEVVSTVAQNTIAATVHENQVLVSGATIKIRLEQNVYLQGQLIAKGNFVYGVCSLNGERLQVAINSIRSSNSIYPVSLAAYDMDGLAGIRIPGSINRDAAKEGTDQAIQTLNMGSLDPSLGAQATAAGIEAAKNLLSKKMKLIKVSVKAGYPLLLASASQINQ